MRAGAAASLFPQRQGGCGRGGPAWAWAADSPWLPAVRAHLLKLREQGEDAPAAPPVGPVVTLHDLIPEWEKIKADGGYRYKRTYTPELPQTRAF